MLCSKLGPASHPICASASKIMKQELNVSTINYYRCSDDADSWVSGADDILFPVDAMYNGTVKVKVDGCGIQTFQSPWNYTLRVGGTGPVSGTNITRSHYDMNSVFLAITYYVPDDDSAADNMTSTADFEIQTSTSELEYGQPWDVKATTSGDGYDISGHLVSNRYNDINQYLTSSINNCSGFYTGWDYKTHFLIQDCNVEYANITGHVSPTKASLTVTFRIFAHPNDPIYTFDFEGNWAQGGKLVTTGSTLATDGKIEDETDGSGQGHRNAGTDGRGSGTRAAFALAAASGLILFMVML